jgi:lipopolysaccharide/colanic/teichoic acid biosynthesis glycosyltransferase
MSAPFLALAAALIRLTSGRPVLFRQERIGREGRPFQILKLRTMRRSDGPELTEAGDPRITPLGKFLRKTKIDELPQLWNVVKGEMSLVGPRPEVPRYVDEANPMWQEVLKARPGMTDPVSVQLRDEEELLAWAAEDPERFYLEQLQPLKLTGYLAYLRQRSWISDVQVMTRTLLTVLGLGSKGASTDPFSRLHRTDSSRRLPPN